MTDLKFGHLSEQTKMLVALDNGQRLISTGEHLDSVGFNPFPNTITHQLLLLEKAPFHKASLLLAPVAVLYFSQWKTAALHEH